MYCVIGSEFLIKGHWYKLKYPFATQHKIKKIP
jgi:hypothetical protein